MTIKERMMERLREAMVPYRKDLIATLTKKLLSTHSPRELRTKAEVYSRSELEKFIRKETGFDPLPKETEAVRAALSQVIKEDATGVRNILTAMKVDKASADRYASLIVKDHKEKKLDDARLKSRLQDIIEDPKVLARVMNMVKDEL